LLAGKGTSASVGAPISFNLTQAWMNSSQPSATYHGEAKEAAAEEC
jgi:hypothetical protein